MAFSTYSEYQNASSSEKVVLVTIEASRRLVGWTVHSGSIYKLTNFTSLVIVSLEQVGTALTSVGSIGAISAGKYYHDTTNQILYLQTTGSVNPNGVFIALFERLFFSNSPVNAPYDLSSGYDVEWLPYIKDTSDFGFDLDTKDQLGVAIEGAGSITMWNDMDYWKTRYDKLVFENQLIRVYSWTRGLPITQAKLIYRGRIQSKDYSATQIKFGMKDAFNELRATPELANIEDYTGELVPNSLLLAKQRHIYGYVYGHKPTNIDQVLTNGYEITGTATLVGGSASVTGSSTLFLAELSPDDEISVNGSEFYSVEAITSNTAITLSEAVEVSYTGSIRVKPSHPKRYTNRIHLVAGHALREPATTVVSADTAGQFTVVDATDMEAGDTILVGSETAVIRRVNNNVIKLETNLQNQPAPSTAVVRLSVSNVRIGPDTLEYSRDYTYDAAAGTLTLDPLAEFNVAKLRNLNGTCSFTNTSRDVTGTSTQFTTQLKPGDWIKASTEASYFEILSITDDTNIKLRTACTYTLAGVASDYKSPAVYDEGTSILVCDVIGKTFNGVKTGTFIKTGSDIVKSLLTDAGLSSQINTASFTLANDLAPQKLGLVIPEKVNDKKVKTFKDYISQVNKSIFASLIANEDFEFEYTILRPRRSSTIVNVIDETDILKWDVKSESDRIVKTVRVRYKKQEADPITGEDVILESTQESDNANYLSKVTKEYVTETLLTRQNDADLLAARWAFFFETSVSKINITSKLQFSRLSINDVVDVNHPSLYERLASSGNRKIAAVESVKKSEGEVKLEIVDFANSFSRCCVIMDNAASDYDTATTDEKFWNGFLTSAYGMLNSEDPDTFGTNLLY